MNGIRWLHRRTSRDARYLAWAAAVTLAIACCSSCSKKSGRVPVYPVRGQVIVGNRPAVKALVVFHPAGQTDPQALRPYGHVTEDGSFQLTTYDPNDGAPAGDYDISIVWLANVGGEDPPDQLKGRYRNPGSWGLKATVKEGPTELPPFQLTR